MSTNKTQNYHLHAWELGDDFLLSEINENFALLDAKATRMVAGTYTGTGDTRGDAVLSVELGFQPRAVLVMGPGGETRYGSNGKIYGGLALPRASVTYGGVALIQITPTGFQVSDQCMSNVEVNKGIKHYMAIW